MVAGKIHPVMPSSRNLLSLQMCFEVPCTGNRDTDAVKARNGREMIDMTTRDRSLISQTARAAMSACHIEQNTALDEQTQANAHPPNALAFEIHDVRIVFWKNKESGYA